MKKTTVKPAWICHECGVKHGRWFQEDGTYVGPEHHCATFHHGECGVCGTTNITVTEPRDYGNLREYK
jgi:hypothetical protein